MGSIFLDGGSTGRSWNRGGHGGLVYGGRGQIYAHDFDGSWGGVSTFNNGPPPDGNRTFMFTSRNAQYWAQEKCVHNRNGVPPENSPAGTSELTKLEGTNNGIFDTVMRNSISHGHAIDAAEWSEYARGGRIAHCVYQNLKGPIAIMRDWQDLSSPRLAPLSDYQWKNCIFDEVCTDSVHAPWTDYLMVVALSVGGSWANAIHMHGITVRDSAGRDGDDFLIYFEGGTSPPGSRSINYMLANYPANFSNWTFVTSNPFTASLPAATNIRSPDIATWFTPGTTANGVSLTTVAAGDAGSGTSLVVNDATWFKDPRYASSDGSTCSIYCNGANRQYTAVNMATNTLTMSSGFARTAGMAVHRSITSGSAPNRGAVR